MNRQISIVIALLCSFGVAVAEAEELNMGDLSNDSRVVGSGNFSAHVAISDYDWKTKLTLGMRSIVDPEILRHVQVAKGIQLNELSGAQYTLDWSHLVNTDSSESWYIEAIFPTENGYELQSFPCMVDTCSQASAAGDFSGLTYQDFGLGDLPDSTFVLDRDSSGQEIFEGAETYKEILIRYSF